MKKIWAEPRAMARVARGVHPPLVETSSLSPTRSRWFLHASILARTWFLEEETVSLFSNLSPLILLPHQQNDELSMHLREIETTINIPLGLP